MAVTYILELCGWMLAFDFWDGGGKREGGMHLSGLYSGLLVPPVGPWGVSVRRSHWGVFERGCEVVWTNIEEGLDTLGILGGLVISLSAVTMVRRHELWAVTYHRCVNLLSEGVSIESSGAGAVVE